MSLPVSNIGICDFGLKAALYNKFVSYLSPSATNLLPQNRVVIDMPKEICQREFAEKQGADTVDFVSMFRNTTEFAWDRQKTAAARIGVNLNVVNNGNTVANAKVIPVDLGYEILFWHHSRDVINQLIETYFFWIQNNPTLDLVLQGYPVSTYLSIKGVRDNSTIRNTYQVGTYWVYEGAIKAEAWLPELDLTGSIIKEIICTVWYKQTGLTQALELGQFTIT
jgi:hypothetical protein